MKQNKQDRYDFLKRCNDLRESYLIEMKFQYWFKGNPCKAWLTFKDIMSQNPGLFFINEEMLRTSIENDQISEVRLDLDEDKLEDNIKLGLMINEQLKKHNIDSYFYYSGGKGIHIQFLINIEGFNIKINQRLGFKKYLLEKMNILKFIDTQPLSPKTLLTCEGYKKRNSKNKARKIYIDLLKYNTVDKIIKYIQGDKENIILNFEFFDNINNINHLIDLKEFGASDFNKNIKNNINIKNNKVNIKYDGKEYKKDLMFYVFVELYKRKDMKSNYNYPILICKYYLDKKTKYDVMADYFNEINKILGKDWDINTILNSTRDLNCNYNSLLMYHIRSQKKRMQINYKELKDIEREIKKNYVGAVKNESSN